MAEPSKSPHLGENRALQGLAVVFFAYLLYLLLTGSGGRIAEQFQMQAIDMTPAEQAAGTAKSASVQVNAAFDAQGFPVKTPMESEQKVAETLIGNEQILSALRTQFGTLKPEEMQKNFESRFGHYWKDPQSADFVVKSGEMGQKLTATANRNRQLVQSLGRFLTSDAGKQVSATLKENLAKAIGSPARDSLNAAFTAWKSGDLERAYQMMKQAENLDAGSSYIQIIAHQAMAFLNMEKHGPLEETMRQYRDLAEEGHRYISSFKPVLEKAGFDPVKLYGRDPFNASGLPTSEQFEKAMNQSRYVQFEREYYLKHPRSQARSIKAMQAETIDYLKKRQKGGQR